MLTWCHGHMAALAGLVQTHGGAHVARKAKEAKQLIGPTCIVGQSIK